MIHLLGWIWIGYGAYAIYSGEHPEQAVMCFAFAALWGMYFKQKEFYIRLLERKQTKLDFWRTKEP